MRINEDQKRVLDSLIVERISNDSNNIRLIGSFDNHRIEEKSCALRNEASQDDESGVTAYYLVKDTNGVLMFYFSLRCGMLYDKTIYEIIKKDENEKNFEEFMLGKGSQQTQESLERDIEIEDEGNNMIVRGEHTYSAIELAHFFRNDNYNFKEWRERYSMPQIGTIVFWRFVVPTVLKAREHVGCQYLYLFAADKTDDKKLINYYADKMKFRIHSEVGTVKPIYDFTCAFMCQEIEPLKSKMVKFFNEEFNLSPDDV